MLPLIIRIYNTQTNADDNRAFTSSPVRIGRNELNDLVIREPFVSQWHSVVWFDDQGARYVDLGSTNGTVVNGQRAEKNVPVPLHEQIDLRIGPLRLFFLRAPVPVQQQAPIRNSMFFMAPPIAQGGGQDIPEARTMIFSQMQHAALGDSVSPGTTAVRDARQQVMIARETEQAAKRLEPAFDQYRRAWVNLFQALQREIGQLPQDVKTGVLIALAGRMEGLGKERDYRDMARALGIGPAALGEVDPKEFIERLGGRPGADPALDMERVGAILEAYSQAFVELRKGYEQFGKDMGVRASTDETPLHRAQSSQQVLNYLLDGSARGEQRVTDLTRGFAEIAIHQVALLGGILEGVRSLLQRLSPNEVGGQTNGAALAKQAPGTTILDLLIPFRVYSLWNRYVARHRSFVEEDRFTREVFGRPFARAYFMVTGGQEQLSTTGENPSQQGVPKQQFPDRGTQRW